METPLPESLSVEASHAIFSQIADNLKKDADHAKEVLQNVWSGVIELHSDSKKDFTLPRLAQHDLDSILSNAEEVNRILSVDKKPEPESIPPKSTCADCMKWGDRAIAAEALLREVADWMASDDHEYSDRGRDIHNRITSITGERES